ncbi:MAG: TRAP transporter substrate-binding protein DctP [Elusimicrobiales bacterium]
MNIFKALVMLLLSSSLNAEVIIKFATLAPEGTNWTKILREFAKDIETQTKGEIRFRIYTGGVQGDERDVVRKIKSSQLNAAGFTGYGIGEIAKEVRVLEAPFLFRDTDEVDFIYSRFTQDFEKIFEKNGFVFLGWTEIGEVYVISRNQIKNPSDFKKARLWIWEGDEIAKKTFENFGSKPIPLSIADVMTSIQTGMIDTVYATPATIIPLGWHKRMRYFLDMPITYGTGAVLISKKVIDDMRPEIREKFISSAKKHFSSLNSITRKENIKATELLKKQLKVIKTQSIKDFEEIAKKTRKELVSFYGSEFIEKIENELEIYRNAKRKNNKS